MNDHRISRRSFLAAAGMAGAVAALTACSGAASSVASSAAASSEAAQSVELIVFAAASLTETLNAIGESYTAEHPEVTFRFNFDSSGTLKTQIQEGADCDLFISAGQKQMNQLDITASADVNKDGLDFVDADSRVNLLENKVCGIQLPEGLKESDKLPEPIYTPSTKAEIGDHDENISYEKSIEVLEKQFPGHGEEYATKLRDYTIALYKKCAEYALSRGIIIADTKFEFGLDEEGNVILGDEMLTPESSRFWPLEGYEAGHGQPSFDKQFVRNWLLANPDSDYDLPQDVIDKTIAKYEEAYEMLTGKKL